MLINLLTFVKKGALLMIEIHVLAGGELFQLILNALAAFMKQDSFLGLLRITALVGIIMATVGFLKTRDPMAFARWFLSYVLFVNLVLLPKTSVEIDDITSQQPRLVDNVPVVFALTANLVTTIGYGLAEAYDSLLSIPIGNRKPLPKELLYTQTGSLFGSRMIQAATSFRIMDPVLKEEMNEYFRICVVGDIRINRKYSVGDLAHETQLWKLISAKASPLRMLSVNEKLVTCQEASKPDGQYSLRKKLETEIRKAYTFFGINLFGKPKNTTYEALFNTHLKSSFDYYQSLTDEASNIFLQSMMINAMRDGIGHYQAFTDATAGIVNQQFTKSQVQHRWSWEVLGQKALWILPITHTCLTLLLFGVFPLIIALTTLPGGIKILYGYLQFFMSLQFWPVLFAILNAGMTFYGATSSGEYGQFSMVNLDKIDELHGDISGACGYLMMLIPFLSHGLVSNLGGAFSNLATSMMSHMQGSSMSAAAEAASGSFALGQTSFYNTTANNFSANKHDSNWTHLHGMHTEQLGSGVLKTMTAGGDAVFDASPGMTKSPIHIADAKALTSSLNQAFEQSTQAAAQESKNYQSALSNFAHRAIALSQLQGHELRLGDGITDSESAQYSNAISTMTRTAKEVAHRNGVSQEDAFAAMTTGGHTLSGGIDVQKSIAGKILGLKGGWDAHFKYDGSSTNANRAHEGYDQVISAQEAEDFNKSRNFVEQFAKTHHFEDSHSKAASLSNQIGADLREAETANHNYDVSNARSMRISQAKSYVESKADQITTDLNQAFPGFVASKVGTTHRDQLFAQPGNLDALHKLQKLADEFVNTQGEQLIAETKGNESSIKQFYQNESTALAHKDKLLGINYQKNSSSLQQGGKILDVGIQNETHNLLNNKVDNQMDEIKQAQINKDKEINQTKNQRIHQYQEKNSAWSERAKEEVLPKQAVDKAKKYLKGLKEGK
jgi:conjugal transfer mating pair stabilization protein TraG